jgi:hypothetical protein
LGGEVRLRSYTPWVEQLPPQDPSHSASRGSVEAATRWLRLFLVDRDVAAAWQLTAPNFRLALVQAIIFLNEQAPAIAAYERDELARQLAIPRPDHPLWTSFANLLAEEFMADLGELDVDNLGAATSTSIGPAYELVLLPQRGPSDPTEPPEMQVHGVLVEFHDERWLIAGLSRRPATPGWPPDLGY